MRRIKYSWIMVVVLAILTGFFSCSKMDEYKDEFQKGGEIIYAGALDTVIAQSGYKRINLKMTLGKDQQVVKVRAYWNERGDSLEMPIQRPVSSDTINMLIPDLAARSYSFAVYTYDEKGHASVVRTASGMAYGDDYVNALSNRTIQSIAPNSRVDSMIVKWNDANSGQILTELSYLTAAGEAKTVLLLPTESVLALSEEDYQGGSELTYRSAYLPNANSYDTFWVVQPSTVVLNALPPYERQFDKSLFRRMQLPTDIGASQYATWPMTNLWNGYVTGNGYATAVGPTPVWFTFDMGQSAKINRFIYWQPMDRLYNLEAVRSFEIYGSNDPNADGSWDSWTFLRTCEAIKPSGSPAGTNTAEDIAAAQAGHEFVMPTNIPKTRYIRIKVLSHWGATATFQAMGELTFFTKDRP